MVIIVKCECVIFVIRCGEIGEFLVVIEDKCIGCKVCIFFMGCLVFVYDFEIKKVRIDEFFCIGCGVCN